MPDKIKYIFIAVIFVLIFFLIFTVDTGAYVGDEECLICHNPGGAGIGAPDKSGYLMTGHKNVLREVVPGEALTGPDGAPYATDSSGHIIDWATGRIDLDGDSAAETVLYYVFNGWMGGGPWAPGAVYAGGEYVCASCHTTGYTTDEPGGPAPGPEPDASFPGIRSLVTIGGSWYLDGIQCERCHGDGGITVLGDCFQCHDNGSTNTQGHISKFSIANITALCVECHTSGNTPPAVGVGSYGVYAASFATYGIAQEFLNSPHGQSSEFDADGCSTCHNVHESTVDAVGHTGAIKKVCTDCHSGKTLGFHEGITKGPKKCEVCHMPAATSGRMTHLWRINPDPNYSSFPTEEEYNAGQETAYTAPHGGLVEAVWLDVEIVCLQCHGESGVALTKLTKFEVGTVAKDYHSGGWGGMPIARFNWYYGTDCYTVNFDATMNDSTTFNWDFGDGHTGAGAVISHTYDAPGSYAVTLTSDYGARRTMIVTAKGRNIPPTTGMNILVDPSYLTGMTIEVYDQSTSNACGAMGSSDPGIAYVLWGDGLMDLVSITTGQSDPVATHTYPTAGTYTIRYFFKDSAGNRSMAPRQTWTLPDIPTAVYDVTGSIMWDHDDDPGTPNVGLANVTIYLKRNSSTIKMGKTDLLGYYEIKDVTVKVNSSGNEVSYTVEPGKNAYSFEVAPGDSDRVNKADPVANFIATAQW